MLSAQYRQRQLFRKLSMGPRLRGGDVPTCSMHVSSRTKPHLIG